MNFVRIVSTHEDKDNSSSEVYVNGKLVNSIFEQAEYGEYPADNYELKNYPVEVTVYDLDVPIEQYDREKIIRQFPLGKVLVHPHQIMATEMHTNKEGFILVKLKFGASYWMRIESYQNFYGPTTLPEAEENVIPLRRLKDKTDQELMDGAKNLMKELRVM